MSIKNEANKCNTISGYIAIILDSRDGVSWGYVCKNSKWSRAAWQNGKCVSHDGVVSPDPSLKDFNLK